MTTNLLETSGDNTGVDQTKDYLKELVGEGKKFKTVEDLARGKFEADNMVEVLKKTSDDLRADYMKLDTEYKSRASLEELVDQLAVRQQQTTNNQLPPVKEVNQPAIDSKQVQDLVSNQLKALKAADKEQDNVNLVGKTLKEVFGENYQGPVKKQLETLDLTEADFNELARTRPNFLLKALGADKSVQQEQFQAPPRNERRQDSFAPKTSEKRTWSYYQRMKTENPTLYRNPKTNVDMHNDMMALGEAFKDGDFNRYKD